MTNFDCFLSAFKKKINESNAIADLPAFMRDIYLKCKRFIYLNI